MPPNQAKKMYEAVKGKGHPVVYKEFEGNRILILTCFEGLTQISSSTYHLKTLVENKPKKSSALTTEI